MNHVQQGGPGERDMDVAVEEPGCDEGSAAVHTIVSVLAGADRKDVIALHDDVRRARLGRCAVVDHASGEDGARHHVTVRPVSTPVRRSDNLAACSLLEREQHLAQQGIEPVLLGR